MFFSTVGLTVNNRMSLKWNETGLLEPQSVRLMDVSKLVCSGAQFAARGVVLARLFL